jgi:hypothetical protein
MRLGAGWDQNSVVRKRMQNRSANRGRERDLPPVEPYADERRGNLRKNHIGLTAEEIGVYQERRPAAMPPAGHRRNA